MIIQPAPAKRADISDTYGRAWRCSHPDQDNVSPLALSEWLVSRPGAHPEIGYWCVGAIALVIDGVPIAERKSEGLTHEFRFAAMDPFHPLHDPDRWGDGLKFTGGFKHQVELPEGGNAAAIVEVLVRSMLRFGVNPLDRLAWVQGLNRTAAADRAAARAGALRA